MMGEDAESLLGGTGQVSGGDPIADKEIPPPPPHPTAPKAVAPPDPLGDEDSPDAIPLFPPAQNDGS
jgi:hypothetical protein